MIIKINSKGLLLKIMNDLVFKMHSLQVTLRIGARSPYFIPCLNMHNIWYTSIIIIEKLQSDIFNHLHSLLHSLS